MAETGDIVGAGLTVAGGVAGTIFGGPAGGALGATIGGTIGGLFGGGGSKESGIRLPPELEFRLLEDSFKQFKQIEADYRKAETMYNTYQQRYDLLAKSSEANIPPEEMRRALAKNSADIALGMGQNVQDLVKNGFLSESDMADLESLKNLESQDFRDPRYDQARVTQKQQLMQNLQRQGASPEQISQALSNFDNESTLGAFSRAEEMRTAQAGRISDRLQLTAGLRQQGFGQAQGTLSSQLGALGSYGQLAGQTAGLYGAGLQAGTAGLAASQGYRAESQGMYAQLGEYSFSKDSKNYLKSGLPQSGQSFTPQGFKDRQAQVKAVADAEKRANAPKSFNNQASSTYDWKKMENV